MAWDSDLSFGPWWKTGEFKNTVNMSSRILSVLAVIVTLTLCPIVKAKYKSEAEALVDMFKTNRASLVKLRVSIDDFVVSLLSKQQNLTDASVLRELEGAVDRLWTKADNITTSLAQFAQLLPGSRHHPKKGILVRIRLPERFGNHFDRLAGIKL